jgi:hypothetical protein
MDPVNARVLDLDGSVNRQASYLADQTLSVIPLRDWGPRIRMACGRRCFRGFEHDLAERIGCSLDATRELSFIGSGDFHHVSLALLRRIKAPLNVLVLDNHPDWMRGIPFMHCGTWLVHAARLPHVHKIFHVGGDVDFDNYYRPLAPWQQLFSEKIVVFPARRRFAGGRWQRIGNEPIRDTAGAPARLARIAELFQPYASELARRPLYVSIDKDVMTARDALVNWDSGHLSLDEVLGILQVAVPLSAGLIGADTTGDWSPVVQRNLLGKLMHWTEHPRLSILPQEADRCNGQVNLKILGKLSELAGTEPAHSAA